jgi:hypothetical protein
MLQNDTLTPLPPDTGAEFIFSDNEEPLAVAPVPVKKHTLFENHELKTPAIIPQPHDRPVEDWITLALMVAVVFYTALFLIYSRSIGRLFKAFINYSVSNQLVRDENITIQRVSVLLSIGFLITGGLVLSVLAGHSSSLSLELRDTTMFFISLTLLAVVYTLKMILVKFLGTVYKAEKTAGNYLFQVLLFNNTAGLIFLPLLIFHFYTHPAHDYFLWSCLWVFAALWCYRIMRGIMAWLSFGRHSVLYLFFYLCALEIAPLLIVLKLL